MVLNTPAAGGTTIDASRGAGCVFQWFPCEKKLQIWDDLDDLVAPTLRTIYLIYIIISLYVYLIIFVYYYIYNIIHIYICILYNI